MEAPATAQMTASQRALWLRISDYAFDDPAAEFPFTERLAKENGWSLGYALRVVEEYRRFAFLAVVAGHPVSPSDSVDQAWHLHQLYSDSYWDDFNEGVLGRTLSHQPTKGGEEESEKFARWYDKTKESYRQFFGVLPPEEIWPSAVEENSAKPFYSRVNHAENWVVGKEYVKAVILFFLVWVATVAGVFGVSTPFLGQSPLNLRGPEFLTYYFVVLAILGILIVWLVRHLREVNGGLPNPHLLDPYVLACLNGGPRLAVYAAIAKLFHEGRLRKEAGTETFSSDASHPPPSHPLEARLFEYPSRTGGGCSPATLCSISQVQTAVLENELEARSLWLTRRDFTRLRVLVAGIMAGLITLGVSKIFVGLSRGKPVMFLLIVTLAIVGGGVYCWTRLSRRTALGNVLLKSNQRDSERAVGAVMSDSTAVAFVVAGLGLGALPMLGMAELHRTILPPAPPGGIGGSCCSTSTCGSSCGGGGGCGGGGCGGCGGS